MFQNIKKLLFKAAWAPFGVLLIHNGISKLFGHKPSLDPTMHFLGGAAMAYFFYQAIIIGHNWFGNPKPIARSFIAYCIAATVTVIWEFLEFIGGKASRHSSQLSLDETMYDLILGNCGALTLLIIIGTINRIKKN